MKKALILTVFLILYGCSSSEHTVVEDLGLDISEIAPDKQTAMTKQNLRHLAKVYHLEPLLFTKKIQIKASVVPHSHPVLTLNTRFADRPNKLLSQWLHEELHWWVLANSQKVKEAISDLKKIYPRIPAESRSKNSLAGYTHLIVCYLENEALKYYLGSKQANSIISDFIKQDKIFPWTYSQVINKHFVIKQVVEKHGLVPPPLS